MPDCTSLCAYEFDELWPLFENFPGKKKRRVYGGMSEEKFPITCFFFSFALFYLDDVRC